MLYDILIIGAGTAGLTAGIYAARAKRSTCIVDRKRPGGQAATTERMENYPGFPGGVGGRELTNLFRDQALEMGCAIVKDTVLTVSQADGILRAECKSGALFEGRALILAPGCEPRRLGIPGEEELTGSGVSYCATCDAELYEDAKVVVVGSGDTAVEEAVYISRFAREVVMVVVHDEGTLDCNSSMACDAMENPKLTWMWNHSLEAIEGDEIVERVRLKNLKNGTTAELDCDGVFMFVGTVPLTGFAEGFIGLDGGYIATDDAMRTGRSLVFAAGDARKKHLRQVVTAASDGATAAFFADKGLSEIDGYERLTAEAGDDFYLYFYFPPTAKSLELFPVVERMAAEEGKKLIKLDRSRYRNIAANFGVDRVPELIRVTQGKRAETIEIQ